MDMIIITTEEVLEETLERILVRILDKKLAMPIEKGIEKITSLVASGILKVTEDNRIYESSLQEYALKK